MSNDDNGDYYDEDENRERKEAEFEFVSAAYTPEEAWVVRRSSDDATNHLDYVHRRLYLPIHDGSSSSSDDIPIELVLGIPATYPSVAPLQIEKASLVEQNHKYSSISPSHRKLAIDALPSLIRTCQSVALDTAGGESVLGVVSRAEEWINEEWAELVVTVASKKQQPPIMVECNTASYFGRKLLYSHHIIAKSKRKAIGDLAKEYKLGGYFKIGWPGIIIIEGEEENCNHFCDEIRSMRWQYLVIRGEEREEVVTTIDALRRFPLKMTELGEDQMSQLSELCQEAGLDDLFRTSMKIYNNNTDDINNDGNTSLVATATHQFHGTLVLVDHMNDPKRYTKWIRKACQSVGCECAIAQCHELGQRPLILVLLLAEEVSSLKQVLKRWRTSRVDVDSKGNPCLERMMNVIVEDDPLDCDDPSQVLMEYGSKSVSDLTITETKSLLNSIGGPSWLQALNDALQDLMQQKKLLLEDLFE